MIGDDVGRRKGDEDALGTVGRFEFGRSEGVEEGRFDSLSSNRDNVEALRSNAVSPPEQLWSVKVNIDY